VEQGPTRNGKLGKGARMEKRIVALFDLHVPYQIELGPVWEFIGDFKPHNVILGGDAHDFTSVSEWISDQSRALVGGTIIQNFVELNKLVFLPLHSCAPKAKIIYLIGNHEDWLRQAIERNPNGKGFWELKRNLPNSLQIVPVNEAYHVNQNLCYLHGLYTTKYHAFQTVHAVHKTVLYGHTHDIQRYTDISPVDVSKFYTGASCGCLCTLNPHYMKNKPNRWVNGFNYCYLDDKTEEFNETQVYIVRNKFFALGRRYC
jgi:predicted phosphodiesterase